jgi:hypothetical protein
MRSSFGYRHFGGASLGDIRRTQRLIQLADEFLKQPDASLPRKCGSPANYQALLNLLQRAEVTHPSTIDCHCQRTRQALGQRTQPLALLVGDITELDFTSKRSLQDQLGPIGNGDGFGYECFNLLAIDPQQRCVIGLTNQLLFRRRRCKLSRAQTRKLPAGKRQSGLWVRATQDLPSPPANTRWVRVFDREGDIDEVLKAPLDYLIRSRTNRRILQGFAEDAPEGKLHTYLRSLPAVGTREVVVQSARARAGRTALCGVSFAAVQIRWSNPNGSAADAPTRAYGVRIWELNPPAGEEGIEWLLLSSLPVENLSDALARVDNYECRWLSEEYHKALKTGVRIEQPQLTDRDRLEPLLGILSVVALELLRVRDAARDTTASEKPADGVVDEVLVEVMAKQSVGVKFRGARMTVGEFYQALARLGGYLGNFKKRPPGWQTLWHGWIRLNTMAQGLRIARIPP